MSEISTLKQSDELEYTSVYCSDDEISDFLDRRGIGFINNTQLMERPNSPLPHLNDLLSLEPLYTDEEKAFQLIDPTLENQTTLIDIFHHIQDKAAEMFYWIKGFINRV